MPFSSEGFFLTDEDMQNTFGAMAGEPAGLQPSSSIGPGAVEPSAAAHFMEPPLPQPSGTFVFLDDMFGPLHNWSAQDDNQKPPGDAQQPGGLDLTSHQSSLPHLRTSSKTAPFPARWGNLLANALWNRFSCPVRAPFVECVAPEKSGSFIGSWGSCS